MDNAKWSTNEAQNILLLLFVNTRNTEKIGSIDSKTWAEEVAGCSSWDTVISALRKYSTYGLLVESFDVRKSPIRWIMSLVFWSDLPYSKGDAATYSQGRLNSEPWSCWRGESIRTYLYTSGMRWYQQSERSLPTYLVQSPRSHSIHMALPGIGSPNMFTIWWAKGPISHRYRIIEAISNIVGASSSLSSPS
jgi:hypothetical protein